MLRIFLFLIFTTYLIASPIEVTDKPLYKTISHFMYTEVLDEDESPLNLDKREWKKDVKELSLLNKEHQSYWIKLQIYNNSYEEQELYLFDERRYVFNLTYYVVENNIIIEDINASCTVNENYSKFNSSLSIFPLIIDRHSTVDVFMKIQNFNQLDTPYQLVTKDYLVEYLEKYNFLQGMFFAILLIMGIYNLIVYLILRYKLYLYHVIYTILLIIYQGSYFGYFHMFNLNYLPVPMQQVIGVIGFLIFVIFFFQELLSLKKHLPVTNRFLSLAIIFLSMVLFFYLWALFLEDFYYSQLFFNVVNVFVPIYLGLILLSLYSLVYKRINHMIKWYAMIWTIVSIAGLCLMLMHVGIIPISWNTDYFFQLAMLIESSLFSTILAFHIITLKQKKIEQEKMLIQQSKLADMGKMIEAIAHQWRQPLSEINGVVLNMDIDHKKNRLDNTTIDKYLDNIELTTHYLSKTIDDFLNFFRHDKYIQPFMLSSIIEDSMKLLLNKQVEKFHINYHKKDNDIKVYTYKSELIQAFLIVLNNSIDALSVNNTRNPIITISVTEIEENVCIIIEDNGGGIPLDIQSKVYDPYFTTKHASQGTGLGLYILKILMEKSMQGRIEHLNTDKGLRTVLCIPKNISGITII